VRDSNTNDNGQGPPPVPQIELRANLTSKVRASVTVLHGGEVIVVESLNIFRSSERVRLVESVLVARPHLDRLILEKKLEEVAAALQNEQPTTKQPTHSSSRADSGTTGRLIEFLRTFRPAYVTRTGEIWLAAAGRAIRVGRLFTLNGAFTLIRTTPEWRAEHSRDGLKPTAEIRLARELFGIAGERLARELFGIAGERLARELPPECADDDAENIAARVRQQLIQMLIEPRILTSGVAERLSFAGWATRIAPGTGWQQCFGHSVYALRTDDGTIRLAVRSQYILGKLPVLTREFTNGVHAGRFLRQCKLVQPEDLRIRVRRKQFRAWELAPDIVLDACGEDVRDDAAPQNEPADAHPDWTDDAPEGHPNA
jgi:hypothetical protein